jgi:hypothetical protein
MVMAERDHIFYLQPPLLQFDLGQKSYAALEQSAFRIFDAQEVPVICVRPGSLFRASGIVRLPYSVKTLSNRAPNVTQLSADPDSARRTGRSSFAPPSAGSRE